MVNKTLNDEIELIANTQYKRISQPSTHQNCVGYISEVLWDTPLFISCANQFYRKVLWRWGTPINRFEEIVKDDLIAFVDDYGLAHHVAIVHDVQTDTGVRILRSKNQFESVFEFYGYQLVSGFSTIERRNSHYNYKFFRLNPQTIKVTLSK